MDVTPEATAVEGCVVLRAPVHGDARGWFTKPYRTSTHVAEGLDPAVAEVFFSLSARGVVRGMHFQLPPHDHAKTVTCVAGRVFDVAVDLRRGSATEGHHAAVELVGGDGRSLYIPRGCAHGFQSLADDSLVAYLVSSEHAPDHDSGVRWDTIGVAWPLPDPVVSNRDAALPDATTFTAPFAGPSTDIV